MHFCCCSVWLGSQLSLVEQFPYRGGITFDRTCTPWYFDGQDLLPTEPQQLVFWAWMFFIPSRLWQPLSTWPFLINPSTYLQAITYKVHRDMRGQWACLLPLQFPKIPPSTSPAALFFLPSLLDMEHLGVLPSFGVAYSSCCCYWFPL